MKEKGARVSYRLLTRASRRQRASSSTERRASQRDLEFVSFPEGYLAAQERREAAVRERRKRKGAKPELTLP